jgi:hypothetical protein
MLPPQYQQLRWLLLLLQLLHELAINSHLPVVSVFSTLAFSTISATPCFTKGVLPDLNNRTGSANQQRGTWAEAANSLFSSTSRAESVRAIFTQLGKRGNQKKTKEGPTCEHCVAVELYFG